MPNKGFKTHRQQIKKLRDKGMDIPTGKPGSEAMRVLERCNYYNLINGYRSLFLDINNPGYYKAGTQLSEIEQLYKLDSYISKEVLGLIINYEKRLKNKSAYFFSAKFKDEINPYLNYTNYNSTSQDLKSSATRTINNFSSAISKYSEKKYRTTPVYHYLYNKSNIPLWVIIERMTFGDVNFFHKATSIDVRDSIAESFKKEIVLVDSSKNISFLDSKFIDKSNHLANIFRNITAHGERVYCSYVNNFKDFDQKRKVADYFGISPTIFNRDRGYLLELFTHLYFLTEKDVYEDCIINISKAIDRAFEENRIFTITKTELLESMGFSLGLELSDILL